MDVGEYIESFRTSIWSDVCNRHRASSPQHLPKLEAYWRSPRPLCQEGLGILHNGPEVVIIKPAQLGGATQQLHQGCDDVALQLCPSAAHKRKLSSHMGLQDGRQSYSA